MSDSSCKLSPEKQTAEEERSRQDTSLDHPLTKTHIFTTGNKMSTLSGVDILKRTVFKASSPQNSVLGLLIQGRDSLMSDSV